MSTRPLAGESYHLFGIAGRGMAPLALAARHLGRDRHRLRPPSGQETDAALAAAGLDYDHQHSVSHVAPGVTFVATSVAPSDEPEVVAAERTGSDPAPHRPARSGAGGAGRRRGDRQPRQGDRDRVGGGWPESAGLDPLAVIGVTVPDLGGMVRLGEGPTVAEVDDSDLSLARVRTEVAVVTNLDDDHPHLPSSLSQAVEGVGEFVARAQRPVLLGPSPRRERLAAYAETEVWRYGKDYAVRTISTTGGTRLELRRPRRHSVSAVVRLLGPQTAANAGLAFATAIALGAEPEAAAAGLVHGPHHPPPAGADRGCATASGSSTTSAPSIPSRVRGGVETLRRHFPQARIIAAFEAYGPYLARWGQQYASALSLADHVVRRPRRLLGQLRGRPRFDVRWTDACSVRPVLVADRAAAAARRWPWRAQGDVVVSFAQVGAVRATARYAMGDPRAEGGHGVKILMTNNTLAARGGSESYLETVSSELRRLGHEVVFFSAECGLVGGSVATARVRGPRRRGSPAAGPRRHPRAAHQRRRSHPGALAQPSPSCSSRHVV